MLFADLTVIKSETQVLLFYAETYFRSKTYVLILMFQESPSPSFHCHYLVYMLHEALSCAYLQQKALVGNVIKPIKTSGCEGHNLEFSKCSLKA